MALLAEELVEEWLNRQGYFTIRGIKIGVDEIDLLAVKFNSKGETECRHIEVQASMRPVSYISRIPKQHRKPNQAATSAATRSDEVLREGVQEWVAKKFTQSKKADVLNSLFPSAWSRELVHNNVKSEKELEFIAKEGVTLISLKSVIKQLSDEQFTIQSASGADFADLITLSSQNV